MSEQPIGWNPDLNDGVRLNIRPFVTAGVLRKNPNSKWTKDRGKDPETAPWYEVFGDDRINDHLTIAPKQGRANRLGNEEEDDGERTMSKRYTVSNGKLMLTLEEAEEGGYIVTSPLDPELITQAETIAEAFANARDAAKALKQSRARLMRRLTAIKTQG